MTPLLVAAAALAGDPSVEYSGMLQSDLRFRFNEPAYGNWYSDVDPPSQIARNRNLWKSRVKAKAGDFRGVIDMDLVFEGFPQTNQLQDLTQRQMLEPFRFDVLSMYIEGRDFLIPNFDLRIGQQLVQFGVGDQFNPTNTFNANDIEDPLLFGDQTSNMMVRGDYTMFSNWTLTGVLIPVFKPSLIPPSGPFAVSAVDRYPFLDDGLRWRAAAEAAAGELVFGYPTVVDNVVVNTPEASIKNMQYGFRLGGWVAMQDIGISYYRGFSDIPVAVSTHTSQTEDPRCFTSVIGEQCIDGLLGNEVTLEYPKIQVLGFNWSGEAFVGYRLEVAGVFPEAMEHTLTNDDIVFIPNFAEQLAGEYEYELEGGGRPLVLDSKPFAKWTLGLDYTIGKHMYVNGQWVHGMLDEFGGAGNWYGGGYTTRAGGVDSSNVETNLCALNRDGEACAYETRRRKLGDFVVLGTDFRFLSNKMLVRLFGIWDLTGVQEEHYDADKEKRVVTEHSSTSKEGFAGVLYPEFAYNFGNGLEVGGGAMMQFGQSYSKFGSVEAGGSLAFGRVRYSF